MLEIRTNELPQIPMTRFSASYISKSQWMADVAKTARLIGRKDVPVSEKSSFRLPSIMSDIIGGLIHHRARQRLAELNLNVRFQIGVDNNKARNPLTFLHHFLFFPPNFFSRCPPTVTVLFMLLWPQATSYLLAKVLERDIRVRPHFLSGKFLAGSFGGLKRVFYRQNLRSSLRCYCKFCMGSALVVPMPILFVPSSSTPVSPMTLPQKSLARLHPKPA